MSHLDHSVARRRVWLGALALSLGMTGALAAAPVSAQGLPDFTELVEKVGPAVVNIRTTERARSARRPGGEPDEDMLEFFRRFGMPIPQMPNRPNPRTPQQPATANRSRAAWARASS